MLYVKVSDVIVTSSQTHILSSHAFHSHY